MSWPHKSTNKPIYSQKPKTTNLITMLFQKPWIFFRCLKNTSSPQFPSLTSNLNFSKIMQATSPPTQSIKNLKSHKKLYHCLLKLHHSTYFSTINWNNLAYGNKIFIKRCTFGGKKFNVLSQDIKFLKNRLIYRWKKKFTLEAFPSLRRKTAGVTSCHHTHT